LTFVVLFFLVAHSTRFCRQFHFLLLETMSGHLIAAYDIKKRANTLFSGLHEPQERPICPRVFFLSTFLFADSSSLLFFYSTSTNKINQQVVHTVATSEIEKQAVYCRCWKSGTVRERGGIVFCFFASCPFLFSHSLSSSLSSLSNSSRSATAHTWPTTPRRETTSAP
jgi:hypothetical protein